MNDSAWRQGIQAVSDEAAGLLDISIIDASTGAELMANAAQGDHESASLLCAVTQAASRIKQAPRRKPALCICCPRSIKRVGPTTVFGVAIPAIADPTGAVGFVFCERCSADRTALAAKAADGLRRIWPDLRHITVTHPAGGRA